VTHKAGPLAVFPGFEQLPDGGSRLWVHLTQQVPVEERKAQGSVTYVLKGAHVRVWNDTNSLVTVHFNTPVSRARLVPQGNDLLFVVDLRAAAAATYKFQENQDKTSTLMIEFPKGSFGGGDDAVETPTDVQKAAATKRPGKSPPPGGKKGSAPPPPPSTPPPPPPPSTPAP